MSSQSSQSSQSEDEVSEFADSAEFAEVACATCGALMAADGDRGAALMTWSRGIENGRTAWTCPTCTRQHARSIEGKLDSAWW